VNRRPAPRSSARHAPASKPPAPARPVPTARLVALAALESVDGGAYANLTLPPLLVKAKREGLSDRDAALATELVYGTVRMQRQLDSLLHPHLSRTPDAEVRRLLRLGTYQIHHLRTPAHAAVSETVAISPPKARGFVNAVLRQVAAAKAEPASRSFGERLSYPDWIVDSMIASLGKGDAVDVLEAMNVPATMHERDDGYVQDLASQFVGPFVDAQPGEVILDLCAAPGGKATAIAGRGAFVVAVDVHRHRCALVVENAERLGLTERIASVCADGTALPFRPGTFDRVLVDAPCSGLGSLRRRPDARWRITRADVDELVTLQRSLLAAAAAMVKTGGTVVFSACTLTLEETVGVDEWAVDALPQLHATTAPSGPGWRPWGRGGLLLPAVSDGMFAVAYERSAG
jgi:16S rRNA (cytosine967-C5)-methyltransferase